MLNIHEVFMSFQGEGPRCGVRTLFIRLQGCNLHCPWCDTKETWNVKAPITCDSVDLMKYVSSYKQSNKDNFDICITGGEPLVQQADKSFVHFLALAKQAGHEITIETNGTIVPLTTVLLRTAQLSVSPKLVYTNDTVKENDEYIRETNRVLKVIFDIAEKNDRYRNKDLSIVLKFVVTVDSFDSCMKQIEYMTKDIFTLTNNNIWIMPMGTTLKEIVETSTELAKLLTINKLPYSLSNRFQIITGCK